jgi:hypothetical protein
VRGGLKVTSGPYWDCARRRGLLELSDGDVSAQAAVMGTTPPLGTTRDGLSTGFTEAAGSAELLL